MMFELNIFGTIGSKDTETKDTVKKALNEAGGQDVLINISSSGGSIIEGMAISEMIALYAGKTTTRGIGIVASAATIILMAGKKKEMTKNSFFMMHNSWGGVEGNAMELEKTIELLKMFDEQMAAIYTAQLESKGKLIGGSKEKTLEEVKKMMAAETWFTADEALEMGFIDMICEEKKEDNSIYEETYAMIRAEAKFKNIPNKIKNSMQVEKKTFLQQLANMFGFKAEITEQEVETAPVVEEKAEEPAVEVKEEVKTDDKAELEAKIEALDRQLEEKQLKLEALEAEIQAKISYKSDVKAEKTAEIGFTQDQIVQASKFINSLIKN
jgi:ATP-dependent protease ClpP protease subunit